MFETRSECSFFRIASSSALLNLAPGAESTSVALLAQSRKADATRSAGRAGIFATFSSARGGRRKTRTPRVRENLCAW